MEEIRPTDAKLFFFLLSSSSSFPFFFPLFFFCFFFFFCLFFCLFFFSFSFSSSFGLRSSYFSIFCSSQSFRPVLHAKVAIWRINGFRPFASFASVSCFKAPRAPSHIEVIQEPVGGDRRKLFRYFTYGRGDLSAFSITNVYVFTYSVVLRTFKGWRCPANPKHFPDEFRRAFLNDFSSLEFRTPPITQPGNLQSPLYWRCKILDVEGRTPIWSRCVRHEDKTHLFAATYDMSRRG